MSLEPLRPRLEAMLEQHQREGALVFNDLGLLNRTHYANIFGVTRTALNYHQALLTKYDALGPKPQRTEDRLWYALQKDFDEGTLRLNADGLIFRDHYKRALGISNTYYYNKDFEYFEEQAGLRSLRDRLGSQLSADLSEGQLVRSRGGKISRQHYADVLGANEAQMSNYIDIFQRYEGLSPIKPGQFFEWLIPEMTEWLETQTQAETLPTRRGRVNRRAFCRHFNLGTYCTPCPGTAVAKLVESYDPAAARIEWRRKEAEHAAKEAQAKIEVDHLATHRYDQGIRQKRSCGTRKPTSHAVRQSKAPTTSRAISLSPGEVDEVRDWTVMAVNSGRLTSATAEIMQRLSVRFAVPCDVWQATTEYFERLGPATEFTSSQTEKWSAFAANFDAAAVVERHKSYSSVSQSFSRGRIRLDYALCADCLRGSLVRSRGGKISRQAYRDRLGLATVARFRELFSYYEQETGGLVPAHVAKIPMMREWFEHQMAAGTLEIRDQKAGRLPFFRKFGLGESSNALLRYPEIAELVAEFDRRIVESGYISLADKERLARLQDLVAGDPPLNRTGDKIKRRAVSHLTGIPYRRLTEFPFVSVLDSFDSNLKQTLTRDGLTVWFDGRAFPFRTLLADGWTKPYVEKVADAFDRYHSGLPREQAKNPYNLGLAFFREIARGTDKASQELFQTLNAGRYREGSTALQDCLRIYRGSLRSPRRKLSTTNANIISTNGFLKKLTNDGLLPDPITWMKEFREGERGHYQSLVQAAERSPENDGVRRDAAARYLKFATDMMKLASKQFGVEISADEQSEVVEFLRSDLHNHSIADISHPAHLIYATLKQRMGLIEDAALAAFQRGKDRLAEGTELLARGVDPDVYWEDLQAHFDGDFQSRIIRKYFPEGEELRNFTIANLLRLVEQKYEGRMPTGRTAREIGTQFFQKRYLYTGGLGQLQAYLMPDPDAVAGALTLRLLSAINISVGRKLVVGSDEPDRNEQITGTGHKSRAGSKPIYSSLPENEHSVKAIKWLEEASHRTRRHVPRRDTDKVFILCVQGRCQLMTPHWYTTWFKRLIATIPEMADLYVLPRMLRPSRLLIFALETGGHLRRGVSVGQHGLDIHKDYVDEDVTKLLWDIEVSAFQDEFETTVIHTIENVGQFLGISAEQLDLKIERMTRSGLGTLCANPRGRPGKEGDLCEEIDCWNKCPQLIVVAIKEDIALMRKWQNFLREQEGEWMRDHPERWMKKWLPWLSFMDAIELKMKKLFPGIWKQAGEIADSEVAQHGFEPRLYLL